MYYSIVPRTVEVGDKLVRVVRLALLGQHHDGGQGVHEGGELLDERAEPRNTQRVVLLQRSLDRVPVVGRRVCALKIIALRSVQLR